MAVEEVTGSESQRSLIIPGLWHRIRARVNVVDNGVETVVYSQATETVRRE